MAPSDESFLPQIVGLFYATFDPTLGPTVLHQVPDDLISLLPDEATRSRSVSRSRERSRARGRSSSARPAAPDLPGPSAGALARAASPAPALPAHTLAALAQTLSASVSSSLVLSRPRALLDFAPMSEYVIPKKSLHGRLVSFLVHGDDERRYRVMGFPSVLAGDAAQYARNEYMWNLCFVFAAEASLDAFEPVVRKCARILRSAELDSAYLSAPLPEHTPLAAVLEQLFEDLNSYSETSIPLDGFNSLELKLFPFFQCHDWDVPVALVDLNALKDDNWDITAARVAQFIDGVNHVGRIAELADADPALTRETMRHLLYYQVVMMIDIFQYSNMYTVLPSFARLVADDSVTAECGPYVTRPGHEPADWPTLCALYAALGPGTTVHAWLDGHGVLARGIDPRRFVSFGIIKGFLARVHRWPVVVDPAAAAPLRLWSRQHPAATRAEPGSQRRVGFRERDRDRDRDGAGRSAWPLHRNDSAFSSAGGGGTGGGRTDSAFSSRGGGGGGGPESSGLSGFSRLDAAAPGGSAFTLRSVGSNASLGVSPGSMPRRTPPGTGGAGRSPRRLTGLGGGGGGAHGGPPGRDVIGRSLGSSAAADTIPSTSSRHASGGVGGRYGAHGHGAHGGRAGGGGAHAGTRDGPGAGASAGPALRAAEDTLLRLLDGAHHADAVQVALGLSWWALERVLGLDDAEAGGVGKKGVAVVYR